MVGLGTGIGEGAKGVVGVGEGVGGIGTGV